MNLYERYMLPPLLNWGCSCQPIQAQRDRVVPQAEGVVLELGFGSGLNLPHYDQTRVAKLYALEPAAGMIARARRRANEVAFPVEVLQETAEELSLPAESVDTILVTYSMCTIPDVVSALAGARRALKPQGKLLFCEHGLAPDEDVRRWQRRIEPFTRRLGGGCHLTRDIPELVRKAGFAIERLETGYLPKSPKWGGFNYWGAARPA